MMEFLTFKTVITPYFVVFVYLLGAVLIPFLLYAVVEKLNFSLETWSKKISFVILVLFIELFWRMTNEFIIVYFKIYQVLQ